MTSRYSQAKFQRDGQHFKVKAKVAIDH